MRILNEFGDEITNPDLSLGFLKEEKIFVANHPATDAVVEQWHYETIAEYPNGGKDVVKVIDIPGADAQEAWDEYETVQRYIPYTEEELAAMEEENSKPTLEERIAALEAVIKVWDELDAAYREGVDSV